jgi:hypothetical protein
MLRRVIGLSLLVAVGVMLCRADVVAQDKMAAPKDSAGLAAGEYFGTMQSTPGSDRTFTLRLEQRTLVPAGGAAPKAAPVAGLIRWTPNLSALLNQVVADQRACANQAAAVARARTPAAKAAASRSLATSTAALRNAVAAFQREAAVIGVYNARLLQLGSTGVPKFTVQTSYQDVEFQATESVKVRTLVLPEQFDEKGNVKKYTKAELAEMRGKDKNLPGFESSLEKLEAGQKVRVLLVQSSKKAPPVKNKDKDKKANDDDEKKMQVKMITIVETEGDAAAAPKGKKKN